VFIAATVPIEKEGDVNHLLEAAKSVGDPPGKEEQEAKPQELNENGIGSYERFMTSFGAPARWAGR
jgi:hypothetical protein